MQYIHMLDDECHSTIHMVVKISLALEQVVESRHQALLISR